LLLPVVLKASFDIGRALTVLPHYFGDEIPELAMPPDAARRPVTAFATVADFHAAYRSIVDMKVKNLGDKKGVSFEVNGFHALGHHVFEGSKLDIANADRDVGRDLVERLGGQLRKVAWLGAVHPVGALIVAAATGGLAGMQLFYESHRETHRTLHDKTLIGLAFEALGWTATRDEHAVHHRPDHMTSFTTSAPSVDRKFDDSGMPSLLNLVAYAMTQDRDVRAIPNSWRRDPRVAQAILGDVDLRETFAIAAAKDALVSVHKTMVRLQKQGHDFLDTPMSSASTLEADSHRAELLHACHDGAVASGIPTTADTTFLQAYQALRRRVDNVEMSRDDLVRGFEQEPLQSKFILELVSQAPSSAWPTLTQEQVMQAVGRLRDRYEPGRA
jgi:hypothetical protein